jgi:phosphoribosylpyrophosphate synthetase
MCDVLVDRCLFFAELTELIARKVGVKPGRIVLGKFANQETQVQLTDNVRGQDVYVIQVRLHPLL